jgi:hypothetical protein
MSSPRDKEVVMQRKRLRSLSIYLTVALLSVVLPFKGELGAKNPAGKLRFALSFPVERSKAALDGRLLLMISTDGSKEPRAQIDDSPRTQQIFGIDIDGLKPGQDAYIDGSVFGYPVKSLNQVPAGTYWVQALLHKYETFHRADGHTVKLPMDRGEGQHWNLAPGNIYSKPRQITIDPNKEETVSVSLDQEIPPISPPKDTRYIKHIKIESKKLTEFWGRPIHLGACILLPHGYDEHPEARYPLMVFHGHFPHTFGGFRETPPDANLQPDYSERFKLKGYNKIQQEYAYRFYQEWIS